MTYITFFKMFPDDESCANHFFKIRYQHGLVCPFCGETRRVARRSDSIRKCACYKCNNSFSMFKNTIYEKSSTSLQKWFFALHLLLNAKKGFSAYQLRREIGVTYKTAWRILRKIREAMGNCNDSYLMKDCVEIDETYIGGKPRKINEYTDAEIQEEYLRFVAEDNMNRLRSGKKIRGGTGKPGRGADRFGVIGAYERNTGKVKAKLMLPNKHLITSSKEQFMDFVNETVDNNTTVYTDDSKSYALLNLRNQKAYDKALAKGNPIVPVYKKANYKNLKHEIVKHGKGTYSNGPELNTNSIEWLWSIVKRSIFGSYHHISFKYAQAYMDEICFRQNHKWCPHTMFNIVISQSIYAKSKAVSDVYLDRYKQRNLKYRIDIEVLAQKALDACKSKN